MAQMQRLVVFITSEEMDWMQSEAKRIGRTLSDTARRRLFEIKAAKATPAPVIHDAPAPRSSVAGLSALIPQKHAKG